MSYRHTRPSEKLAWGCVVNFDDLGLPVYEDFEHVPATCECAAHREEILISHLQIWEGHDAEILQIDDNTIALIILELVDRWNIWNISEADRDWIVYLREHVQEDGEEMRVLELLSRISKNMSRFGTKGRRQKAKRK